MTTIEATTAVAVREVEPLTREMVQHAETLVVDCPPAYEHGLELLRTIKQREDVVEAKRKELKAPILEAGRRVDGTFSPLVEALRAAATVINRKLSSWRQAEERRRQEEEARIRREALDREAKELEKTEREAQKLEAKGRPEDAELVRAFVPEPAPLPVVASEVPKVKGAGVRDNWRFEIVDGAKIPREYLMPDEVAIGKVVRALKEKTNISGIRVYNEEVTSVRRTPF